MAGLGDTGFSVKRYDEILSDKRSKAQELFGSGVDTSVNSLLGQLVQLSSLELAVLWEELQNVYDSFNPNAATGKSLDDLCSLVGVYRYDTQPSSGFIEFTGNNGTLIPSSTQVSNPDTGDEFVTINDELMSIDSCYSATYEVRSVSDSATYSVIIDGITISVVTDPTGNTVTTLRDALVNAILAETSLNYVSVLSIDADKFIVTHTIIGNSFQISTNAASISPTEVTCLILVNSVELGSITADSGSITSIDTAISGLTSVNNLSNLVEGRDLETDDELRLRRLLNASQVGKATPEAIARSIEALQGVSDAFVIENRTLVTDAEGRPPKSYEAVVVGGESSNIADTIWKTGPAGIETYGSVSEVIVDSNGDAHSISFSRPENVYISFEVDYQIYDEELFPSNGVQAIKDAVIQYGNETDRIGLDVIPQRFFGDIYRSVSGISNIVIRVGSSTSPSVPPASFATTPISINARQLASFDVDRVTVTEV